MYIVKYPEIVMTLKSFQIFWFCGWKCQKECVKVCDNLKSWIPSHRRFHRYLKLQKRTYIAKVMRILPFSQKYIFYLHKIVLCHRIAIWGLRSARIEKLEKTDPHFLGKNWILFPTFFVQATIWSQIEIIVMWLIYA